MQTYDAHKTAVEARQGSRRLMNFRVLIWSMLAIVAAFGIIYAVSTAMQPGAGAPVTQPAVEAPVSNPAGTPTPAT